MLLGGYWAAALGREGAEAGAPGGAGTGRAARQGHPHPHRPHPLHPPHHHRDTSLHQTREYHHLLCVQWLILFWFIGMFSFM